MSDLNIKLGVNLDNRNLDSIKNEIQKKIGKINVIASTKLNNIDATKFEKSVAKEVKKLDSLVNNHSYLTFRGTNDINEIYNNLKLLLNEPSGNTETLLKTSNHITDIQRNISKENEKKIERYYTRLLNNEDKLSTTESIINDLIGKNNSLEPTLSTHRENITQYKNELEDLKNVFANLNFDNLTKDQWSILKSELKQYEKRITNTEREVSQHIPYEYIYNNNQTKTDLRNKILSWQNKHQTLYQREITDLMNSLNNENLTYGQFKEIGNQFKSLKIQAQAENKLGTSVDKNKIQNELDKLKNINHNNNYVNKYQQQEISKLISSYQSILGQNVIKKEEYNALNKSYNDFLKLINRDKAKSIDKILDFKKNDWSSLNNKFNNIQNLKSNLKLTDFDYNTYNQLQKSFEDMATCYNNIQKIMNNQNLNRLSNKNIKNYKKDLTNGVNDFNKYYNSFNSKFKDKHSIANNIDVENLKNIITNWTNKNPFASKSYKNDINKINEMFRNGAVTNGQFDYINEQFKSLKIKAQTEAKLGNGIDKSKIQNELETLKKLRANNNYIKDYRIADINNLINNYEKLLSKNFISQSDYEKYYKHYNNLITTSKSDKTKSIDKILDFKKNDWANLQQNFNNIQNLKSNLKSTEFDYNTYSKLQKSFEGMVTCYNNIQKIMNNQSLNRLSNKNIKNFEKDLTNSINDFNKYYNNFNSQISNSNELANPSKVMETYNNLLTWGNRNKRAVNYGGLEFNNILNELSKSNVTKGELDNIIDRIKVYKSEMKQAGKTGDTFLGGIKNNLFNISKLLGSFLVPYSIYDDLKQMYNNVKAIDTAMTELYKVTDETDTRYEQFLDNAIKKSEELGRTIDGYITQVAEWSKLGYSLNDSEKLAYASSIYANVGGLNDTDAVSDMVTAMKAFNIEANEAMKLVDSYNELGNKYAVSSAGLGTGLSKSASALALAGNDLHKSLAMLTGMSEITQNAQESGNALKVVSMRIRGYDEETQSYTNDVEQLNGAIANLTKTAKTPGGISIFKDKDKQTYKDTYLIFNEISKIWDDLSNKNQAELLETLAGKQRGNSVGALIQAFQSGQVESAYNDSLASDGSAMKEQERRLTSIEAKTQQLSSTWQNFSQTVINSEGAKILLDTLNKALKVLTLMVDKVGTLKTLAGGFFATKLIRGGKPCWLINKSIKVCHQGV